MKSLSIIVPIYGDGALAMDFCQSLVQLKEKFLDVSVNQSEVIFVSDGVAEDIPSFKKPADASISPSTSPLRGILVSTSPSVVA